MSELKEWHFFDKVYRRWLVLFICTPEAFVNELKLNGYTQDVEWFLQAKGACLEFNDTNNDKGQDCTIIWLKEYETTTLVHEITHLVMMLFDQVGVPISRDNTESFAFYTEYWFSEIQKARRKFPNGRPPKEAKK